MALQVEVTRPARRVAPVDRTRMAARSRLHARPGMARTRLPMMGRPQAGARPRAQRLGWRGRARPQVEPMARQGLGPLEPVRQAPDAARPPWRGAQQSSRAVQPRLVQAAVERPKARPPAQPRAMASRMHPHLLAKREARMPSPQAQQGLAATLAEQRAARWTASWARSAPCAQPSLQLLGAVNSPLCRSCVRA